jgi:hypothetical protein
MDETHFVKNKDAGNYRFDPFCDALEIYLKRKDEKLFDFNFFVSGQIEDLKIISEPVDPRDWFKSLVKLSPESTIDEFVKYICEKRQATQELAEKLIEGLKDLGGANVVCDLFGWLRSDFATIKVKPTYISEL